MAIQISKKSSTQSPAAAAAPVSQKPTGPTSGAPVSQAPTKKSWYTRGDQVKSEIDEEDARVEREQAARGSMWRFWLTQGETNAGVTFVDGDLTAKGILDCFMYREHELFMNGKWGNYFVCTAEQEPCPICESGDQPSLVGVFTIIDHRTYKGKKNTYVDTAKLFVAKRGTLKQLQTLAVKRGGLAGTTWDVSRMGEKAPKVGDVFDFTVKTDIAELRKKFVKTAVDPKTKKEVTGTIFVPANYEKEIRYYTAAELRKMGFGKGTPIGAEAPPHDAHKASSSVEEALG